MNIIQRFVCSLNPRKYILISKEKLSKAFLYVLILSLCIGIIKGAMSVAIFSTVEKSAKILLENDNLKFELKDGILSFNNSPLKEEKGQSLLLIDTNKSIAELDSLKSITVHKKVATVILNDGVMIKNGSDTIEYRYTDLGLGGLYINNDIIIKTLKGAKVVKYIVFPICIIAEFVQVLIYGLLLSLVGVLSNLISNRHMKFSIVFNLSLYTTTLPILINCLYPVGSFGIIIGGTILIFGLTFIDFFNKQDIKKGNDI